MRASNRQLTLLRFFGIRCNDRLTSGAAGWEISQLFADEKNRELWRRYVFFTRDFDGASAFPIECDRAQLLGLHIPDDWDSTAEVSRFRAEFAAQIIDEQTPFDSPAPDVVVPGRCFVFTGKFTFGTREDCHQAIWEGGGEVAYFVSELVDFLVIGSRGSRAWKRGSYGRKIEDAINIRRDFGKPAIVSEELCGKCIGA